MRNICTLWFSPSTMYICRYDFHLQVPQIMSSSNLFYVKRLSYLLSYLVSDEILLEFLKAFKQTRYWKHVVGLEARITTIGTDHVDPREYPSAQTQDDTYIGMAYISHKRLTVVSQKSSFPVSYQEFGAFRLCLEPRCYVDKKQLNY